MRLIRILLVCSMVVLTLTIRAQDEQYENRRISNALSQHSELHGLAFLTDASRRHRLTYEYGEFFFDDFIAGPKFSLFTTEDSGQGFIVGFFAKNYFLNGEVRLFGQVEMNVNFLTEDDDGNFFAATAAYVEYALQPGATYALDFGSDILTIDMFFQYSEPIGKPKIRTQGGGVGIRLAYIY